MVLEDNAIVGKNRVCEQSWPIAICTDRNRDLNRLLNRRRLTSWAQFDWELKIKHQRRAHNWFL